MKLEDYIKKEKEKHDRIINDYWFDYLLLPVAGIFLVLMGFSTYMNGKIGRLEYENQELKKSEHIKDSLYLNCNSKIIEVNKSVSMYEGFLNGSR